MPQQFQSPLRDGQQAVLAAALAFVTLATIVGAIMGATIGSPGEEAFFRAVAGAVLGYFIALHVYFNLAAVWDSPLPRVAVACGVWVIVLSLFW